MAGLRGLAPSQGSLLVVGRVGENPGDEVSVGLACVALRIRSFSNDDGEGDGDGDEDVKKAIGVLSPLSRFMEDRKQATNFFSLFLTLSAVPK